MGVRVEVLYNCPLGEPGVVLKREDAVWWILVDSATPAAAAQLAIDLITSLAQLPEWDAEEPETGDEGGAMALSQPPLLLTRPGGWVSILAQSTPSTVALS